MIHFTGKVSQGRIIPDDPIIVNDDLNKLHDKEVEVTIRKTKVRSNPQNRYYWGVVVYLIKERFKELGYTRTDIQQDNVSSPITRDDVHMFLRENFLRDDWIVRDTGVVIGTVAKSTRELSTDEFVIYLENVRNWAAETLEIDIPDPDTPIQTKVEIKLNQ